MKKKMSRILAVFLLTALLVSSCGSQEIIISSVSPEEVISEEPESEEISKDTEMPSESVTEDTSSQTADKVSSEESSNTEPSETETQEITETTPDDEEDIFFTPDEYPVVDGSTATKPLAKAFYEAFTKTELPEVNHSKTHQAYLKLINKEADLILVVDPSEDDKKAAEDAGVELQYDTVVNEAFVFFVNSQNPVQTFR